MSLWKTNSGADLNSLFLHNLVKGEVTDPVEVKFTNPYTYTMTNVRVALQLSTGTFEDTGPDKNEKGQEMQDEGWVEVRRTSGDPWTLIGGPYGMSDADPAVEEGTRFLQLPDMAPGATESFQMRLNIPADAETERIASARWLVSWAGDVPGEL